MEQNTHRKKQPLQRGIKSDHTDPDSMEVKMTVGHERCFRALYNGLCGMKEEEEEDEERMCSDRSEPIQKYKQRAGRL